MKFLIVAGLASLLVACSPSAETVSDSSFDASKIAYFQDKRTGFCFSMIAVGRMDSGMKYSESVSHSHVPCNDEVMKLLRKNK